jgi:hypothetical protein
MNPELRRDGDNPDGWVSYAQQLLAEALSDEAAAGDVRLSAIDDVFGPITEASVQYFQQREGLAVTGVVDEPTWIALGAEIVDDDQTESDGDTESGAGTEQTEDDDATPSDPVDLRVPFELQLRWDELQLDLMLDEFQRLDLTSHPSARLTFPEPVGRLFGNGGMRWLEYEFQTNPTVFVEATTRAIIGWSSSQGLELGADNQLDAGLRFRGFDLFLSGELDARVHPMEPSGSISGAGTINIRLNIDAIGR